MKAVAKWHSGQVAQWPRGQSLLEYAVLVAAVVSALVLMSDYVRKAFNAHAEAIEEELNGATDDNPP